MTARRGLALRVCAVASLWLVAACDCTGPVVTADGGGVPGDAGGGQGDDGGGFRFDAGPAPVCTGPRACYTGASGTQGVGACHAGAQPCRDGMFGPCVGDVTPVAESCNGIDDDCNGVVDDGELSAKISCGVGACLATTSACIGGKPGACIELAPGPELCGNGIDDNCDGLVDEGCACIHVAKQGDDTNDGTQGHPLGTLMAGIARAADAGLSAVCVGLPGCPSSTNFGEEVVMVNGVSVLGGFELGNPWTRNASCVIVIGNLTARGVYFGPTITSPTAIEQLTVYGSNDDTNAAVTVDGSKGALITNSMIHGGNGSTSVGIDISGSATPTILSSTVTGGTGTTSSIAINSVGSRPTVLDSCSTFTNGVCTSECTGQTQIFARPADSIGKISIGVQLDTSPGALIDRSAICSGPATQDAAGVRITGDATGTIVRHNTLVANDGLVSSVGVWADNCANAPVWLFANDTISGGGEVAGAYGGGVLAIGDCPVRVDSNHLVSAGLESAIAIDCINDPFSGHGDRCTIVNTTGITAGAVGSIYAAGVHCAAGSCALIEGNTISSVASTGSAGVVLENTNTRVSRNHIEAGCTSVEGVGLLAIDTSARVENNEIHGSYCASSTAVNPAPLLSAGVKVLTSDSTHELDLSSNTIFGEGGAFACTSIAFALGVADAGTPDRPTGIARNNIFHAGICATALPVAELAPAADPRVLENNDLWSPMGNVLYLDEGGNPVTSVFAVNVFPGATSNISADPRFGANILLTAGSPCRNAGTDAGAPADDLDGHARPQEGVYDIGAEEFVPQ